MIILSDPISNFSFEDVVRFCDEGQIEGTQLDYKKEVPKNLAKHFASFSNTRGGVIIIGADEDSKNGKPKDYIGVVDDGKVIDRIHQFAANVSPRPRYELHRAEDSLSGKMFVLIRIEEGDKTPYYVQNDPHVYIRTGNISDPIEQAGSEMLELLFRKRERASQARELSIMRSEDVFQAAIRKTVRSRERTVRNENPDNYKEVLEMLPDIGTHPMFKILIQPYYPFRPLCNPEDIKNKVGEYREQSYYLGDFPSLSVSPFQDGGLVTNWNNEGIIDFQQLYSFGLVRRDKSLRIERETEKSIYISHVAAYVWITLKAAKNFYKLFKYQGVLLGNISIDGIEGFRVHRIMPSGWHDYSDRNIEGMLNSYSWPFEIEMREMEDEKSFQQFYIDVLKEIYWSLGMEYSSIDLLRAFFKEMNWEWVE